MRIHLEDSAALVWRAYPFVVSAGAAVDRDTTIVLGAGAALCLRETLVLGRTGERGGALLNRFRAHGAEGLPLHLEDLDLDGERPEAGVLGTLRVLDSAILLGRRPPEGPQRAPLLLHLAQPGAIARTAADATHATGLDAVFDSWAGALLGPGAGG